MAPIKFEENMKDRLEKRTIQPSADAWSKLADRLDDEQNTNTRKVVWWLGIAASIAILIFSGIFFFNKEESQIGTEIVNSNPEIPIKDVEPINTKDNEQVTAVITEKEDKIDVVEEKPESLKPEIIKEAHRIIKTPKSEMNQLTVKASDLQDEIVKVETSAVAITNEQTTFEQKKFEEVMAEIKTMDSDGTTITEREIDSLLKEAQKEILTNKIFNESSRTVDADALLQDVEGELDRSFRTKVFEALKTSYNSVKTAVAERNN